MQWNEQLRYEVYRVYEAQWAYWVMPLAVAVTLVRQTCAFGDHVIGKRLTVILGPSSPQPITIRCLDGNINDLVCMIPCGYNIKNMSNAVVVMCGCQTRFPYYLPR